MARFLKGAGLFECPKKVIASLVTPSYKGGTLEGPGISTEAPFRLLEE
jgi:hypothetical protein